MLCYGEPFNELGLFGPRPFYLDCIITTCGYDFREGQAADAAFYSTRYEAAKTKGVKRACVPQSSQPRASNANASRKSDGSAMDRNGAPDPKGASAWLSGGTDSTAADTRASSE
jgi:hypothetical protein